MKVSIHFHTYIRMHGPQNQKCYTCGAIHLVDEKNRITLKTPGQPLAKLSQEYPYPEYAPYRVGAYRVRYSNGNWSKTLVSWNGEVWSNGPIVFHVGSIVAWQGLAGDMEHTKRMPYDLAAPLPDYQIGDEL
jgi:hypothetical protein